MYKYIKGLENKMERFRYTEKIVESKHILTEEKVGCENISKSTGRGDASGRLILKIHFKNTVKDLGNSFCAAKCSFFALENRLESDCERLKGVR